MNSTIKKVSDNLRAWFVSVIREGVAPPVERKPMSTYVQIMYLTAASALVADGVSIPDAARATGVEVGALQRWIARHRHTWRR